MTALKHACWLYTALVLIDRTTTSDLDLHLYVRTLPHELVHSDTDASPTGLTYTKHLTHTSKTVDRPASPSLIRSSAAFHHDGFLRSISHALPHAHSPHAYMSTHFDVTDRCDSATTIDLVAPLLRHDQSHHSQTQII